MRMVVLTPLAFPPLELPAADRTHPLDKLLQVDRAVAVHVQLRYAPEPKTTKSVKAISLLP